MSYRCGFRKKDLIHGFTIIEFIVACSLISIVAIAACISIRAYTDKLYLKREAIKLRLFLERFYATALIFRQRITVQVSEKSIAAESATNEELQAYTFLNNTTCLLPGARPLVLFLHPTIATSPKTITLKRGASFCKVIVSLRGRIRVAC